MHKKAGLLFRCLLAISLLAETSCGDNNTAPKTAVQNKTEIILPEGFSSSIVADTVGPLRHIAVNRQGDIYVKLSGLKNGKGIYCLSDTDHDGKADKRTGFGNYPGTGILIKNDVLYASSNTSVFKYALDEKGQVKDTANPQVIVKGLIDKNRDNSKSIAVDDKGNLYVTIGSYDETCTLPNSSMGMQGCPLLDSVGGVWQFKTDLADQSYNNSVQYGRGLKNVVGINWNSNTHSLFVVMHGRGSFSEKFPQYYSSQQDAELPAEAMYELQQGADAGWPFIYYDQNRKKKMLSPEYGGDGKKTVDNKYIDPVIAFPAHLGPNDLLFYTGNMFPEKYHNGAFIAFHSKSSVLKKGYFVAFVPFINGKPSGQWEIFADNFAGIDLTQNNNGAIQHRPMGLAQGPDGALYVADDIKGTIYKIIYTGNNK
ncbi:MAG TPA: PQQ-dependent sugar dehydrogenase [Puia sp.]|nr:PQQ-dependent sugar dehydrogenase [Puia sp.]